ncbi:hypothetical protein BpHYR1_005004 [Brachionus plicatilis]|uniref:Uncharacterized protein n=1 Tax=Brachionus plicatilis TaxID=10195 RepID=A0A3M7QJZ3_BRAPC|nr:hypothetical protein BpHYR1_005004 [Brachionus plicatilis]
MRTQIKYFLMACILLQNAEFLQSLTQYSACILHYLAFQSTWHAKISLNCLENDKNNKSGD